MGVLAVATLFVVACGGDDDAQTSTEEPAAAATDSGADDEPSAEPAEEPDADTPDEPSDEPPAEVDDDALAQGGQVVLSVPVAENYDETAIFRWGYTVEATSLDPHRGSSGFDQNWLLPTYDRLIYMDPDGVPQPMLATDWELVDDGAAIEMGIREGVVFHDGAALDAEAVKLSLDRAMTDEASTVQTVLDVVDSVEVVDDYQIRLNLAGPPGALIANLADRAGMIISPDALENADLDRQPVGAGPYRVANYVLGDRVVYEKFEDYWNPEIQRVAGMEIRVMSADETRFNSVLAGETDVALARESQVASGLEQGLNLLEGPTPNFYSMAVNASVPPFDDPLVRRALNLAIDRETIAEVIFEGHCQATNQPFPETSWAYNAEMGHGLDVYDPDEARRLLEEAGLPDGFEFDVATSNITGYTTLAEVLQAMFADIGVTMNLQISDQVSQLFAVEKSLPAVVGAYAPTPDPSGVLDTVYKSDAINNPGGWTNETLEQLADEGLASLDVEERAPIYHQMVEEIMTGDSHYYPICMRTRQEFFRPGTTGISIYVSGARDWSGVAIAADD